MNDSSLNDSSLNDRTTENLLFQKIESIEHKVNEILAHIRKDCHCHHVTSADATRFKKVSKHSELLEFQMKLKSNTFKDHMQEIVDAKFKNMDKYSKSYRRFGYDVIDTFCSRRLFKQYSWSGKRTRHGNKNYSLHDNINFINFIFDMIHSKMESFSYGDLEDIFSVLCRNKNSRHISRETDSSDDTNDTH